MISEIDEEENVTTHEYDALSRFVKVNDPLTGEIKRTYDDRGNLLTVEDPNNGFTRYAYDRNNRLRGYQAYGMNGRNVWIGMKSRTI